jgi:3-phosphoshikimate 1-carboxyvinyltransferase
VHADSVTVSSGTRRAFIVDLTDSPDLYPLAGVLAAISPGTSQIRGAYQVVHKESDRRAETVRLARSLGASVRLSTEALTIDGTRAPRPLELADLTDHRLVMSAAVGALAASGVSHLGSAETAGKSYPGFWDALRQLGAEVHGR